MPRMWWTPDGGSQERRTLLRDGSVLDPRTPHVVWGNDQTGNRGIITFVMQPQKNRSTSRVPARGVKSPASARLDATRSSTPQFVRTRTSVARRRGQSFIPSFLNRSCGRRLKSRRGVVGPRRASGESRRVDSRSRFNLWSYS